MPIVFKVPPPIHADTLPKSIVHLFVVSPQVKFPMPNKRLATSKPLRREYTSVNFSHKGWAAVEVVRQAVASQAKRGRDWKLVAIGAGKVVMIVPIFEGQIKNVQLPELELTKTSTGCPHPKHLAPIMTTLLLLFCSSMSSFFPLLR